MEPVQGQYSSNETQQRAERSIARLFSLYSGPNSRSFSQTKTLLDGLPRLTELQVELLGHKDSVCPICFNNLIAILSEEEVAIAMDSPAHPVEELGVTRLAAEWQCGHLFCRRDISKWIVEGHDTCPTCRRSLLKPHSTEQTQASSLPQFELEPTALSLDDIRSYLAAGDEGSLLWPSSSHARPDDVSGMYS